VFQQRAQIRRDASVTIGEGETTVEFGDLPRDLDRASLQVSCTKSTVTGVTLKGVSFSEVRTVVDSNARRAALEASLETVRAEGRELQDEIAGELLQQKALKELFSKATAVPAKTDPAAIYDPATWSNSIDFEVSGFAESRARQRAVERKRRDVLERISSLEGELAATGSRTTTSRDVVRVFLGSPGGGGAIVLQLTYVVPQASWTAYYDVRVDSTTRKTTVVYQALVKQWTAEEWTDIPIELSTAKAHLSGSQPELQPWRVRLAPKVNYDLKQKTLLSRGGKQMEAKSVLYDLQSARCDEEDSSLIECGALDGIGGMGAPMAVAVAEVSEKATSFFFAVPGVHTVLNNSTPKRVTVMQGDLTGEFSYVAIPKLMPHAYLLVKAPNTLGCPLLAGDVNVFMDNNYVSTSTTEGVASGDVLSVWLGVDDGVVVKHKLVRRVRTEHGSLLTGKKIRVTYEYVLTLRNSKASQEHVKVRDQFPISSDSSITVTLVEPEPGKNDKKEDGSLEWSYQLEPKQAVKINITFYVQYPADKVVDLP